MERQIMPMVNLIWCIGCLMVSLQIILYSVGAWSSLYTFNKLNLLSLFIMKRDFVRFCCTYPSPAYWFKWTSFCNFLAFHSSSTTFCETFRWSNCVELYLNYASNLIRTKRLGDRYESKLKSYFPLFSKYKLFNISHEYFMSNEHATLKCITVTSNIVLLVFLLQIIFL